MNACSLTRSFVSLSQLPHTNPYPGKRSVIILDNASIHHCRELLPLIVRHGLRLHYTPPYCYDCTPLDNGAFGWVRRYLQKQSKTFRHISLKLALHRAFKRVSRACARCFFRNCEYM